ncbi:MAG: hypothetical protein HDQ97_10095 [Lachnospiraceae bacterium]|nr:hypothetical protein [Lachnospiraceae bacterium]
MIQYNAVFLNLPYAEGGELLIEVVIHEVCQFQKTFATQFFQRREVHMGEDKVEGMLIVKTENFRSQNQFEKINTAFHAQRCFGTVEYSKEDSGIEKIHNQ